MTLKVKENFQIRTNLELDKHDSKPTIKDAGVIVNTMSRSTNTREVPLYLFAKLVSQYGMSFYQGVMKGGSDADWGHEQSLFAVDIDNSKEYQLESVQSLLSKFREKGIDVFLIYESFSSSDNHKKYRVVIVSDEPFTDAQQTKQVIEALIRISPQADTDCKNLGRVFYGSNKGVAYLDYVCTPKQALLNLIEKENMVEEKTVTEKAVNQNKKVNEKKCMNSDFGEEIRRFNLAEFIANDTNQKGYRVNEGVMFHWCPICGHYDDLSVKVSEEENLFFCHSTNGHVGGNILTYLRLTRKVDIYKARYMFDEIRAGQFTEYLYKNELYRNKRRQHMFNENIVQSKIIIVDSIMGSGKTTWCINEVLNCPLRNYHFLYITPYLKEVERIKSACKHDVYEPHTTGNGKLDNLKDLICLHYDIVSTHELFRRFDEECLWLLNNNNYILILDESLSVIEPFQFAKKDDFQYLKDNGNIIVHEDGLIEWVAGDLETRFDDFKADCKNRKVYYNGRANNDSDVFIKLFNPEIFVAFTKVFILTYMFNGTLMKYYFDLFKMNYETKSISSNNGRLLLVDYYEVDKRAYQDRFLIYEGIMNENIKQKKTLLPESVELSSGKTLM